MPPLTSTRRKEFRDMLVGVRDNVAAVRKAGGACRYEFPVS